MKRSWLPLIPVSQSFDCMFYLISLHLITSHLISSHLSPLSPCTFTSSSFFIYCLFLLHRPDGIEFTVPTPTDVQQMKRGDVVTFSYTTYTAKSTPTQPRILHTRRDVSWDDVLRDHATQNTQKLILNGIHTLSLHLTLPFILHYYSSRASILFPISPFLLSNLVSRNITESGGANANGAV